MLYTLYKTTQGNDQTLARGKDLRFHVSFTVSPCPLFYSPALSNSLPWHWRYEFILKVIKQNLIQYALKSISKNVNKAGYVTMNFCFPAEQLC